MDAHLAKVPFVRLLLPLLAGIVFQYYIPNSNLSLPFLFAGLGGMLVSYLIRPTWQYRCRWLFGAGLYLFIFSLAMILTLFSQNRSEYNFPATKESYKAVITDIPQNKEKTIACKVRLSDGKKIICYFQSGIRSRELKAGDEILFYGQIQPFKHFSDPDEFDYPRYMYNQGFSGSVYLYSASWEATEQTISSPKIMALECRQSILRFYDSLGLDDTGYAILSALTLGYKDNLSDDLKQSFRVTGTAHILAVSGMHVGIIYGVIISVLALFCRRIMFRSWAQVLIMALLWCYAFLTGLSPSVIRAVIMLSIFCLAHVFKRRGLTYNNIAIAAFFMLVYEPFYLFDVGFQLSFTAVLSICVFQPILSGLIKIENKFLKIIWGLFTLSVAAQLGTFPLCLFYFGIFPTYFFITNMLVVPLVSFLFYAAIIVSGVGAFSYLLPVSVSGLLLYVPVGILKLIISVLVAIVRFFEELPHATIETGRISGITLFLLFALILSLSLFYLYRKPKVLIISLTFTLLIMLNYIGQNYFFRDKVLNVYTNRGVTEIKWNSGQRTLITDSLRGYEFVAIDDSKLLIVNGNCFANKNTDEKLKVDYLYIVKSDTISLYSLTQTILPEIVLLDVSLSAKKRRALIRECEKLQIPYYDMAEKGMFRTNF